MAPSIDLKAKIFFRKSAKFFKMIEIEYVQDEIYYWLVFTVFFSVLAVFGGAAFVVTFQVMLCMRRARIERKAQLGLNSKLGSSKEMPITTKDTVKIISKEQN